MTRRVIDLDQLRSEQDQEPIEVKVGGQTFQLPPSLPVALSLQVGQLVANDDLSPLEADAVFRALVDGLVGPDRAEAFCALLSMDELQHVVVSAYGMALGESSASAASSSRGGKRSRQTRNGSTARS